MLLDVRSPRSPLLRQRRRGFTLIEILIVVAIIAIALMISVPRALNILRRQTLEGNAGSFLAFVQQASIRSQRANAAFFVRVNAQQSDTTRVVELFQDANNNGTFEPASDTLINQFTLPKAISLSRTDTTAVDQTLWEMPSSGVYTIGIDVRGRAITPSTGVPIQGVATMTITHSSMVTSALRPLVDFQLRINPLWNVSISKVVVP